MHTGLTQKEARYLSSSIHELEELLEKLCKIPAPSNHEEKRAEFCKRWLMRHGAKGVYIDSALNVIYPVNCENSNNITVFLAHTDTVFPDITPLPYRVEEKRIYAPGVGDNTISLAIMLMIIKYTLTHNIPANRSVLFVANSGEEGLGNLKGVREIARSYEGRLSEVIAFDGNIGISDRCVGSHRYMVEMLTEGGHSFGSFGNKNAIVYMSKLINNLYKKEVPKVGESMTTYNVGTITGGTSVNTIAQSCKMLYEYRSDNSECLSMMKKYFESMIEDAGKDGVTVNTELLGTRPCMGNMDLNKQNMLAQKCIDVISKFYDGPIKRGASSTDCNIPLSLGIPAVRVGVYNGGGAHTRDEWLERDSLPVGMRIAMKLILSCFS